MLTLPALLLATFLPVGQDQPLAFSRPELELRIEKGNQQTRRVRLDNHGSAPVTIQQILGTHECVTLLRTRQDEELELPEELNHTLAPGEHLRFQVRVDSIDLAFGPTEFQVQVIAADGLPMLELPVRVSVRQQDALDPEGKAQWLGGGGKRLVPKGLPPTLRFDHYVDDFGDLFAGEIYPAKFRLTNEGEGDLYILAIRPSCNCSVARLVLPGGEATRQQLAESIIGSLKPGEEAILEVDVDTTGMGGNVIKNIVVVTNDDNQQRTTLKVGGFVRNPFQVDGNTFFEEVRQGGNTRAVVEVSSSELTDFDLVGFEQPSPPLWNIKIRPHKSRKDVFEVVFRLRKDAPFGAHAGRVKVAVDHDRVREFPINYGVTVVPDLAFTVDDKKVDRLDFRIIRPPANTERTLVIKNLDPETPYLPTDVRVESRLSPGAFEAELKTVEEGQHYEVLVRFVKPPPTSFLSAELILEAPDYVALKEYRIGIKGTYQGARKQSDSRRD